MRADTPTEGADTVFPSLTDPATGLLHAPQQVSASEGADARVAGFDTGGARWLLAWTRRDPSGTFVVRSADQIASLSAK